MNDWTPLHCASKWGQTDIARYLVSKGANKSAKTRNNKTPYDLAKRSNEEMRNILK